MKPSPIFIMAAVLTLSACKENKTMALMPPVTDEPDSVHPAMHIDGNTLWQEYTQAPDTHPNIPNCSYAGYHYGEDPIPVIEGPVYDVRAFGAQGDGAADDTQAIRDALAAVGDDGGVVYLPDGEYLVSGVLFIHKDKTVLRGESEDGTIIRFTKPLNEAYRLANYPSSIPTGYATKWNYSGGLIWVTPESRGNTYLPEGTDPTGEASALPDIKTGWHSQAPAAIIAEKAERGDRVLHLRSSVPSWKPGDIVILIQKDPGDYSFLNDLCGGGEWAAQYDWTQKNGAGWANPGALMWPVELKAVDWTNNTVTLRQPLRFDVDTAWKAKLVSLAKPISECGIESLTLICERDYQWTVEKNHHIDVGWNPVYFNNAVNCWLTDVTMVDAENGLNVESSKCLTLQDFTIMASSPELMTHHHGTTARGRSADILFSDFDIESQPMHGINVEGFTCGVVWMRGVLEHGIFDTHRQMPFENMKTDVTLVNNDGARGGMGGPLMGARCVNWNVTIESGNPYIAGWANTRPHGALVGLQGVQPVWDAYASITPTGEVSECRVEDLGVVPEPENLYEAQLALRLATEQ